jgi:protein-disulfide isomerase
MPRRYKPEKQNKTNWIVVSAVAAVVVVGVLIALNQMSTTAQPAPAASTTRDRGSPDAPVTIEEYADFQCPICARAAAMLNLLAPQYFDTGKARLVYKHFAFIGPESEWAAQASECAAEQNKFWPWADYLFQHQVAENIGTFSRNNLKQYTTQVGLDTNAFNQCFDSNKYASLVQQQTNEGRSRGVRATPSFFVNGQFVEGLLSKDDFARLIDSKLPR